MNHRAHGHPGGVGGGDREPTPDAEPQRDSHPGPTDNVLFGAAAIAAIGATMAVVLDDQRKRQQLLDEENAEAKEEAAHLQVQEDAYLAGQAAQAKAQAKYQAALYGQYEAQQQELDAEAALAAARNTLPSDVVAVMSGTIYNDPETDDTDANVAQAFREADDASMEKDQQYEAQLPPTQKPSFFQTLLQDFNYRLALPEIPVAQTSPFYKLIGGFSISQQLTISDVNHEDAPTVGNDAIDIGSISVSPDKVRVTPLDSPIKTAYGKLGTALGVDLPALPIDPWEISGGVDIYGQTGSVRTDLNINFDYVYRPDTLMVEALAVGTLGIGLLTGAGIEIAAGVIGGVGAAGQALGQALQQEIH